MKILQLFLKTQNSGIEIFHSQFSNYLAIIQIDGQHLIRLTLGPGKQFLKVWESLNDCLIADLFRLKDVVALAAQSLRVSAHTKQMKELGGIGKRAIKGFKIKNVTCQRGVLYTRIFKEFIGWKS